MSKEDYLTIDAGGTLFKTTRATASLIPILQARLARWSEGNVLFLDVDSELFRHVLNSLRMDEYEIPAGIMKNVFSLARSLCLEGFEETDDKEPTKDFVKQNSVKQDSAGQDSTREKCSYIQMITGDSRHDRYINLELKPNEVILRHLIFEPAPDRITVNSSFTTIFDADKGSISIFFDVTAIGHTLNISLKPKYIDMLNKYMSLRIIWNVDEYNSISRMRAVVEKFSLI